MATTPIQSKELEYACMAQVFAAKDPTLLPIALDPAVLKQFVSEGAKLYRTKTAGVVQGDGWKLDFGIRDDLGVINATLGDLFRLPKAQRERMAEHVVTPGLNARFLRMKLGMGACTDEGEIEAWDGELKAVRDRE